MFRKGRDFFRRSRVGGCWVSQGLWRERVHEGGLLSLRPNHKIGSAPFEGERVTGVVQKLLEFDLAGMEICVTRIVGELMGWASLMFSICRRANVVECQRILYRI